MFVITTDQVGSRRHGDRAAQLVERLTAEYGDRLLLAPDQTAGDEVQLATDAARTALDVCLDLTRTGHWSVGIGIGEITTPLPDAARKAGGSAFVAAREAVDAAKRADGRVALRSAGDDPDADDALGAADVEALLRLLVLNRARRSDEGWEVVDLMRGGRTQQQVAAQLAITPAAVSLRLKHAMWRADEAAQPAVARLLDGLDRNIGRGGRR